MNNQNDLEKFAREAEYVLGMDYGAADIGLALASLENRLAFAYCTLKNNKYFLQKIGEIINEENAAGIVIGIPSHVNRREVEYPGEKIGRIIAENFKIKIFYQDEMFTTKMAQKNLIEIGVKNIKRFDDQEAARIILQEWIDRLPKKW